MRRIVVTCLFLALAIPGCATSPPGDLNSDAPAAAQSSHVASAPSSTLPPATAAAASFDPALAAKLQTAIDRMVKVLHYPALSAAVILPNGTSWSGPAGKADAASGTPATPDTAFAIASITKTFVAALVLELVQDGVLSLDDPIATWLPQLAGDPRFAANRVTVRQLLDDTSGIADCMEAWSEAALKDPTRRWTPDAVIAFVGDPTFAPGTRWAYSNTNYILAGIIIERASGATVASSLRRRILDPLELAGTVLQQQEQPTGLIAHGDRNRSPAQPSASRSTCRMAAGSCRMQQVQAGPGRRAASPPPRPTWPAGPHTSTAATSSTRHRWPRCSTSGGTPASPVAARTGWGR